MDDLISRSQLLELLEDFKIRIGDVIMGFVIDRIIERVKNMPTADRRS